eukprot:4476586-Pleurochrysis_carterae.AAC.1
MLKGRRGQGAVHSRSRRCMCQCVDSWKRSAIALDHMARPPALNSGVWPDGTRSSDVPLPSRVKENDMDIPSSYRMSRCKGEY